MNTNIIIATTTVTHRRTYVAGTSLEEHRALLGQGYTFDRLAKQYRKTVTETAVCDANGEIAA